MLRTTRIATLAAVAVTAIVPALGSQAAQARIAPFKPCPVKWILPPNTTSMLDVHTTSSPEDAFDGENATTTGSQLLDFETVEHDDLTYPGC